MTDETPTRPEEHRQLLLHTAKQSIEHGLQHGRPLTVDLAAAPEPLRELRATFVTLHLEGQLRGCIGTLEPVRPLIEDVAENAFAAAFRDPRFGPVRADELGRIRMDISVLGLPTPIEADNENELLVQLRPGVDGLILEDPPYRSTFLPSVWEQVTEPVEFVAHLKRKAGLAPDHWSQTIRFQRYTTETIE